MNMLFGMPTPNSSMESAQGSTNSAHASALRPGKASSHWGTPFSKLLDQVHEGQGPDSVEQDPHVKTQVDTQEGPEGVLSPTASLALGLPLPNPVVESETPVGRPMEWTPDATAALGVEGGSWATLGTGNASAQVLGTSAVMTIQAEDEYAPGLDTKGEPSPASPLPTAREPLAPRLGIRMGLRRGEVATESGAELRGQQGRVGVPLEAATEEVPKTLHHLGQMVSELEEGAQLPDGVEMAAIVEEGTAGLQTEPEAEEQVLTTRQPGAEGAPERPSMDSGNLETGQWSRDAEENVTTHTVAAQQLERPVRRGNVALRNGIVMSRLGETENPKIAQAPWTTEEGSLRQSLSSLFVHGRMAQVTAAVDDRMPAESLADFADVDLERTAVHMDPAGLVIGEGTELDLGTKTGERITSEPLSASDVALPDTQQERPTAQAQPEAFGSTVKFWSEYDDTGDESVDQVEGTDARAQTASEVRESRSTTFDDQPDTSSSQSGSLEAEVAEPVMSGEMEMPFEAAMQRTFRGSATGSSGLREMPSRFTASVQPESLGDVIRTVTLEGAGEAQAVRVELHPREMGRLHLRVSVESGSVSAQIMAESEATRQAIEAALPELRQVLQEGGLSVGTIQVSVGTEGGGFAFGQSSDLPQAPSNPIRRGRTGRAADGYTPTQAARSAASDRDSLINVLA